MDIELLKEVLNCLCGERTVFHYTSEQYAVYLLKRIINSQEMVAIRDLQQSRWANLLKRSALKNAVSQCGDGYLRSDILRGVGLPDPEPFVLTLGEWGAVKDYPYAQTSRPGANLVLHLNLSRQWEGRFEALVKSSANSYFDCGHPLSASRPVTLAWARLDVDFATDEVLIEEVQSDLIRSMTRLNQRAQRAISNKKASFYYCGDELQAIRVLGFTNDFCEVFKKVWQEAMLAAAVSFVFDELGISTLYYHSFETGNKMKNIKWSSPPRSLYTDLPKKFCFESTSEVPLFLQRDRKIHRKLKKLGNSCWFRMAA